MPPKYQLVAKNVHGKVSWFNRNLGTGRIFFDEFGEVFVKHSSILRPVNRNGDNFLLPSQPVVSDILRGPKGLRAVNVKVEFAQKPRSFSSSSRNRNRNSQPPSECSGSQAFVPLTAPDQSEVTVVEKDLRGEVLEFDSEHGHGMLLVRQYGNITCFSKYIDFWGTFASKRCLQATQIVKCDIGRARNGTLFAINVNVISEANPAEESRTTDVIASDLVGTVISYSKFRKYGFIRLEGSDNVYFNHFAFINVESLSPNQVVKFDLAPGPKSAIALNIRLAGDSENVADSNSPQNPIHCNSNYVGPNESLLPKWKNASSKLPDLLSSNNQMEPVMKKFEKIRISEHTSKEKTSSVSKKKLSCNICQEGLEDAVSVPCGHLFCRECIGEWIAVNPSCPVDGRAISRKSVKPASLVAE